MDPTKIPVTWFDLIVVILLLVGVMRGKKRGLSEELLDVFKWLTIVVMAALFYMSLGDFVSEYTGLNRTASFIGSYIFFAIVISLIFGWLKRMTGQKLIASDVFGGLEYILGMVAGATRYGCMIVMGLAILNAKHVSPDEVATEARVRAQNPDIIHMPTFGGLQQAVFAESYSGRLVKTYLNEQLIVPTQESAPQEPALADRRERLVDEAFSGKVR